MKKYGDVLELIEVKAKSFNSRKDKFYNTRDNYISTKWLPYLSDVAFQTWMLERAFPDYSVIPYLMLANKEAITSVDGLNQHFFLKEDKNSGRTFVEIKGNIQTPELLGEKILINIPVKEMVEKIWQGKEKAEDKKSEDQRLPFEERIQIYADYYKKDKRFPVTLGQKCKKCEYRISAYDVNDNEKIGYRECWNERLGWDEGMFDKPHIFDIWNFRKGEECIRDGNYLIQDLIPEEIFMTRKKNGEYDYDSKNAKRQYLQYIKAINPEDQTEDIKPGLYEELNSWNFPLHFIDFETTMVAIPFYNGRHPYEQIAFQFSSHTIHEDGSIKHDQWISEKPGKFPNFDFVTALKNVLNKDEGTILRFAAHENTVLRQIHNQIIDARDNDRGVLPTDYEDLITFIDQVTTWKDEDGEKHPGERTMIDMCRMVQDYYYHPAMGGSNSIKAVLPAVLQSCSFLKEKYSKSQKTTNSGSMIWWQNDPQTGLPINPYELLPALFDKDEFIEDELVLESDHIHEGGAAMTAYAQMQFTEMSDKERNAIIQGLLKYCELDTLAMVMIWEHWQHVR